MQMEQHSPATGGLQGSQDHSQEQRPAQLDGTVEKASADKVVQEGAGWVANVRDKCISSGSSKKQRQVIMQLWSQGTTRPSGEVRDFTVVQQVGSGGFAIVLEVLEETTSSNSEGSKAAVGCSNAAEDSSSSRLGSGAGRFALKVAKDYLDMPDTYRRGVPAGCHAALMRKQFKTEYDVMSDMCDGDFVLKCFGVGSVEWDGTTRSCLLVELAPHGSVHTLLTDDRGRPVGLSPKKAHRILMFATYALAEVNGDAKALYRDLKAENLLMFGDKEDPLVKLADFGICKVLLPPDCGARTVIGTPEFKAPEQENPKAAQDMRVDTYQLALLLLQLRWGRAPFWWLWELVVSEEERKQRRGLSELEREDCPYNQEQPGFPALTPKERAFLQCCMCVDVSLRPFVTELIGRDDYIMNGP
jgi:serine/threonine protein kinase